jgi:hypothetical protein
VPLPILLRCIPKTKRRNLLAASLFYLNEHSMDRGWSMNLASVSRPKRTAPIFNG